jgi:regulatory protein
MDAESDEQKGVMAGAGRIEAFRPDPARHARYLILFDHGEPLSVHEDVIVALELRPGMALTQELAGAIAREQEASEAFQTALKLLGVHPRSRSQLAAALRKRTTTGAPRFSPEATESALEKLENLGLVNDETYAQHLAQSLIRRKSLGRTGLRYQLRAQGIAADVVERAVEDSLEGNDESQRAAQALQKRLPRWEGLPAPERRAKAYQYLARLGFDSDVIRDALAVALEDD